MSTIPSGTVTFLFTDLVDSTRLWEKSPTVMRDALAWHDDTLRRAIDSHGGYIFATGGDGFSAAFSSPMEGAAAAIEAQHEFASREWPDLGVLRVRMGLDAGIVEERDGDYFGPPVNRAARVMALADGGDVFASHTAADLLRHHLEEGIHLVDIGERKLKGVPRPEAIFAVEYGPRQRRARTRLKPVLLAGVMIAVFATISLIFLNNRAESATDALGDTVTTSGVGLSDPAGCDHPDLTREERANCGTHSYRVTDDQRCDSFIENEWDQPVWRWTFVDGSVEPVGFGGYTDQGMSPVYDGTHQPADEYYEELTATSITAVKLAPNRYEITTRSTLIVVWDGFPTMKPGDRVEFIDVVTVDFDLLGFEADGLLTTLHNGTFKNDVCQEMVWTLVG